MTSATLTETCHEQAREWLLDCYDDEYDQEQIQAMTYQQIRIAIAREYDGGWAAFLQTVD